MNHNMAASESKGAIKQLLKRGSDVKLKLEFLKRRSSKETSPVRPSSEEADTWAQSFYTLMNSKYGQALFRAFLAREYSEENIEFWLAVEDYRKCREAKLSAKAHQIFADFITHQAPKEVNLDSKTKRNLATAVQSPSHSTFDQAQKSIQAIIEGGGYCRFLKSELYLELVNPEIKPELSMKSSEE